MPCITRSDAAAAGADCGKPLPPEVRMPGTAQGEATGFSGPDPGK